MGNMAAGLRRVSVQPVRDDDGENRLEHFGIGHGLSELDFMARQRYLENSRLYSACSRTVSVASQPIEPKFSSSTELHHFIHEQRKIISTFRAQPWPMQMKLTALRCYKQNLSKYVHHLNTIDTFWDSSGQVFYKLRRKFRAVCQYFTVWGTLIKGIEGHFGTSVASFFTFLRWLFALNLILTALVLGLVVIPQGIFGHGLDVPESAKVNGSALSFLLDGKGYIFEYSVLFYGFYDSGQNEPYEGDEPNPDPYIGLFYKLPLAYMLIIVSLFIVTTAGLLFSMAEKYKLLQRANTGERYPFSWKVFASWDNTITDPDTASGKKRHIIISLKETIVEERKEHHSGIHVKLWIVRALTNLLVLVCLVSTSYAIFLAVENAERTNAVQQRNFENATSGSWEGIWLFLASFQVQVVVSARNLLLPYVFTLAQLAEKLHPRSALKLMLVRMFCLYVSSLYVLIIALFTQHCKSGEEGQDTCCWETMIGQELYKLSITHFLADVASIILADILRWLISKMRCFGKIRHWVGLAEFNLADNILRLVYGQALILLGVLFCPFLPFIGILKNILLFYCRAFAVYFFNKPPRTLFRVASTKNFYMGILLITVFLCALPVGYAVVQMTPSDTCGPFRGLPNMLNVVVFEIYTWPGFIQTVFEHMQTATVIVPVLAFLGITIYYYAALSNALKEVNKDLSLQLHLEQNAARERIAKEVRPKTAERRHEQLQKAIQAELRERQMARMANQGSTSPGGLPDPPIPQPDHTTSTTGWAEQGRHTTINVETPRTHAAN